MSQENTYSSQGAPEAAIQSQPNDQRSYWKALHDLANNLPGKLVLPGDPDFEAERAVWTGRIDCHPALIVRCAEASDVIAAVAFAREQNLPLSVRSGGHSPAGHGTNNGGIVIDLSRMKALSIDAEQRTARLEPGLTWGEVAQALQPYGLGLTSGDASSVGVGGLLLSGGIGWMVRKYGLTLDHLRAVELVTANGERLRVSANEYPELFWGLRGGGGNFGIATAFEVDLHPAGMVLGGAVFYDIAEAESVLQAYTRFATTAPEELTTMALFTAAPPAPFIPAEKQGKTVLILAVCYTGDLAQGEQVVEPLLHLGTPIAAMIAPMPYPAIFSLGEDGTIRGLSQQTRAFFRKTVTDDFLKVMVEAVRTIQSPTMLVQMRVLGGAMSRVPADATAFSHRDKQALLLIANFGPDAVDSARRTDHAWQMLRPHADGAYVGFLGDEGSERVYGAYSPANHARLAALKQRYDPTNLFRLNQNIGPTL